MRVFAQPHRRGTNRGSSQFVGGGEDQGEDFRVVGLCVFILDLPGSHLLTQRGDSHTSWDLPVSASYSSPLLPVLCFRFKPQEEKGGELLHGHGGHLPDSAHRGYWAVGGER